MFKERLNSVFTQQCKLWILTILLKIELSHFSKNRSPSVWCSPPQLLSFSSHLVSQAAPWCHPPGTSALKTLVPPMHHHATLKGFLCAPLLPFFWKGLITTPPPLLDAFFFQVSSSLPFHFLHHCYSYYCSHHNSLRVLLLFPLLSSFFLSFITALPTLGFLLLSLGFHPTYVQLSFSLFLWPSQISCWATNQVRTYLPCSAS